MEKEPAMSFLLKYRRSSLKRHQERVVFLRVLREKLLRGVSETIKELDGDKSLQQRKGEKMTGFTFSDWLLAAILATALLGGC